MGKKRHRTEYLINLRQYPHSSEAAKTGHTQREAQKHKQPILAAGLMAVVYRKRRDLRTK
jgi:hypothetical protein